MPDEVMEYLEVVDENDRPTGVVMEKELAHQNNEYHRTAHIWLINGQNQLLIQKRSKSKSSFPGYWDISSAGHIQAQETVVQGALRELKEELGVSIEENQLKYITKIRYVGEHNREFGYVFLVRTDLKEDEYVFEDHEVERVEYIYFEELERMIAEKRNDLLVHNNEEELLFRYIRGTLM